MIQEAKYKDAIVIHAKIITLECWISQEVSKPEWSSCGQTMAYDPSIGLKVVLALIGFLEKSNLILPIVCTSVRGANGAERMGEGTAQYK